MHGECGSGLTARRTARPHALPSHGREHSGLLQFLDRGGAGGRLQAEQARARKCGFGRRRRADLLAAVAGYGLVEQVPNRGGATARWQI
ncbi:bsr7334 [Bradyrhizobium diazoefficiens USDA 110]|uniref:Bsr7334 protein n=1 Tax=Bradyrhizobium diazoefficiens (strain JCM 10833 / BCRC 13528 / IAM 13628 / NBRC 14792 / USDA 110) TaxID=224911 RepID=Q89DV3_BRADU|nr:hypothetical protein CO678_19545 [Bradyrhizobium diazoefficiens]QBP26077.1 hypothetical protein Bdiaspc4_38690 [Bradyrhizobium diazoefficiens]QHP72877.1 hypothetical protein EI171_39460 [Bradyrhizobium sp. LCT2]BAC52599.1 bsr7334 [Bradyrhizobium diazoefficiens USDA 110]